MTQHPDPLHFTPVPMLRRRAQGWCPDTQRAFIDALSRCGVVAQAARSVGRSPRSAYHLRRRAGADSFAAAWDWALDMGLDESRGRAIALIHGKRVRPIVRRGEVVGQRTDNDPRLMFAALNALGADRDGRRDAMPHRQRMALRHVITTLIDNGPFSPEEWARLVPALAAVAGADGGGPSLS
jgi:hypothetical protein